MVPDDDLEYLNWALEVARMDTGDPPPLVYWVIQNELARRGLATHKGVLWLAQRQLKEDQKNKPAPGNTKDYVILGRKKTK